MSNTLKIEKKAAVISMLAEGASIRAVERITGIHGDTIGRLALRVGNGCQRIMDEKLRNLNCSRIEVDEVWGFIGMKQKTAHRKNRIDDGVGDIWTWVSKTKALVEKTSYPIFAPFVLPVIRGPRIPPTKSQHGFGCLAKSDGPDKRNKRRLTIGCVPSLGSNQVNSN